MIPNPDLSSDSGGARAHVRVRPRRRAERPSIPVTSAVGPWGIKHRRRRDAGGGLRPGLGGAEIRHARDLARSKNGGGGWDHPIHIHFEEGQILARNGSLIERAGGGARPEGRLSAPPEAAA